MQPIPEFHMERRVFITEGKEHFQIFKFSQAKDGSIYATWPDFTKTNWVNIAFTETGPTSKISNSPGEGKLTIHGSGMAGFRAHVGSYNDGIVIHGNLLKNPKDNNLGIRHLFTAQINQPHYLPNSPASNRKSDYIIKATKLVPAILVFFAIPIVQKISIEFKMAGSANDLIPAGGTEPSFLGFHIIELTQHMIFWLAYNLDISELLTHLFQFGLTHPFQFGLTHPIFCHNSVCFLSD
jgi:hypothetical protein